MRYFFLMIAAVILGCGGKEEMVTAEAKETIDAAIRKAANKPTGELTKVDLEKVIYLRLINHQLTDVPMEVEKLTKLMSLSLQNNQLTDIKGLEKLTQLTRLHLNANKLTEVPKGLKKLTQLTSLGLGGNKLTDVKVLEELAQLEVLYLQDNHDLTKAQIAELKKALPKCKIYSNPTK